MKGSNGKDNVKVFVSDMYKPYFEVGKMYFKNALFVVDKYHYVRRVYWALDRARKSGQKTFSCEERRYFKRVRKLLHANPKYLDVVESKLMLERHNDLYVTWLLKEEFREYLQCKSSEEGRPMLKLWPELAESVHWQEFKDGITAFNNRFEYILNSLNVPYANGFIEEKTTR